MVNSGSCRTYFNRIVVPYSPDTMLFYAGDNDIGSGTSAEELLNEFMLFTSKLMKKYLIQDVFISIKPSIFRKNYLDIILDLMKNKNPLPLRSMEIYRLMFSNVRNWL